MSRCGIKMIMLLAWVFQLFNILEARGNICLERITEKELKYNFELQPWHFFTYVRILDLDWRMYPNFCVSARNQDLPTTFCSAGNWNVDACKSECNRNSKCSAIEWYWWGYGWAHCNLILSDVAATKGYPGKRWKDATCYIKPIKGEI